MNMVLLIVLFLLITITCLKAVSSLISLIFGAPSVDSSKKARISGLKLANLKQDEIFYDLGSSHGQVLKIASRDFGAHATGFEIAPFPFLVSKIYCSGDKNIKIKFENFLKADLTNANVIYCYLWPSTMEKLALKFSRELKPDTRVVSLGFAIPNKKPTKTIAVGNNKLRLYKY